MKKKALILAVMTIAFAANVRAGGLMTNTNYHIAFDRMMARGATFDIDAAYSNPAGLAWGHEGWQLSLNFQKPWQNRDIKLGNTTYEGKASAPIVPALFASYKKDKWQGNQYAFPQEFNGNSCHDMQNAQKDGKWN